ncbi:MAG: hypothetical protein V3V16_15535 [Melioribacteraceae bacterium]
MFSNINGKVFFDDEIELLPINGHTFSQQMVKLSDASTTFLFCADLIPTVAHISLPYIMGYDINPMITIEEKKKYLTKTIEENWKIIFGHDPRYTCATVKKTEKGFFVKEKFKELV